MTAHPSQPTPSQPSTVGAPSWTGVVASLLLAGAAIGIAWPLLVWDPTAEVRESADQLEGWFFATTGSSPGLTLGLGAWLLWRRLKPLRAVAATPGARWPALPLGAIGAGLVLWSRYVAAPELIALGLPFLILAGGAWTAGVAGLRILWLPAAFMLLAFPVPVALANEVLFPLQMQTGRVSSWILAHIGVPNLLVADQIHARGNLFQVIETCAGLRSMETMLLGAALYLELFYRNRSQGVFLALMAPLVGIVVNVVRVVTIVLNPYSEFASVHSFQGMIMLFVGMFVLAGLDWLHARATGGQFNRAVAHPLAPTDANAPPAALTTRTLALATALGTLVVAAWWLPPWPQPKAPAPPIAAIPSQLAGWKSTGIKLDKTFLGSARFSRWLHRRYERGGDQILLFVGEDDRRDRFNDVRSPKTALPGTGWMVVERAREPVEPGGPPVDHLLLRSELEWAVAHHWYEDIASAPVEVLRSMFVLDRGPLRRDGRALVVRVSAEMTPRPGGREAAEARLREFTAALRVAMDERGIL